MQQQSTELKQFDFSVSETKSALEELCSLVLATESGVLMLSLDWSNVLNPADDCEIAVSDSSGVVHVVSVSSSQLTLKSSRTAHEFEAWIVAFDYFDTNVLYSGKQHTVFPQISVTRGEVIYSGMYVLTRLISFIFPSYGIVLIL